MEVPHQQNQSVTNDVALSSTSSRRQQLKVPWDVRHLKYTMSLTSLSPTITTLNRSILFSPLSSNGQEDTLSNYSLFKPTGHLTSSQLILMVTHSSLLPATSLEASTTLTRLFINGMVPSLFFSSLFPLVEPSLAILSRSAVIPSQVWPITTTEAINTTHSQLCTRRLEQTASSTKRFPLMELMI